jgi:hypothetical protein
VFACPTHTCEPLHARTLTPVYRAAVTLVLQVPVEGLVPDGEEEEEEEGGRRTTGKKHHLSDAEQMQLDLKAIPEVLKRYNVQADGVTPCPDCKRSMKDCNMLTQDLCTRYIKLRYAKEGFLRSGRDIVDWVQEHGGWTSEDTKQPTGLMCLEPRTCLCFGKLMACLSVKDSMRKAVVNSLRYYETVADVSVWTGELCTPSDREPTKQLAVVAFLEVSLIASLSEVPTDSRREISQLCLRELHQSYNEDEELEGEGQSVSYGYFCALFKRWLKDTKTSIRKTKTVEGWCADCVRCDQGMAVCRQQNDAAGVAQWKREKAAHVKLVMALKQDYYRARPCLWLTCVAWR